MSAFLQSPLLAILKSRRARERVETKDQGAGLEKENVVMREGEGERRQKNKPFAARPRDVSAGSRAEDSLKTPPDFTPRRRRLRKMGKDALRKFQQKREGPPVAQRLSYEDTDDDGDGDGADLVAAAPGPTRATGKGKSGGAGGLDDVLKSLGGLGLGEAGAAAKVAEAEGEAEAVAPSPPSEDFEDRTEEISAAVEATAESQGTQMELKGGYKLKLGFPLFPHQEEGIRWLWKLHRMQKGGILADDMGLGKTMQISAYLSGLFLGMKAKRALVVAPKTLLKHWVKELTKCGLGDHIHEFYGGGKGGRVAGLERAMREGGVVLTTYGMVLHNSAELKGLGKLKCIDSEDEGEAATWDYMVLDEGHVLKNPKIQAYQRLREIKVLHRIILTGTPVQNNMRELHALMDFVCEGILGDRRDFRHVYERPITDGLDKAATHREREVGKATSAKLQGIISEFILRRDKETVFGKGKAKGKGAVEKEGEPTTPKAAEEVGREEDLPTLEGVRKNDLVVWLKLSRRQQNLYMSFLQTEGVFKALNETGSALAALDVLRKICTHTDLLTSKAAEQISRMIRRPTASSSGRGEADDSASCKLDFIKELLPELSSKGHRTLIFSQSRQMLDRVEAAVRSLGLEFCRIDGSISSIEKRQEEVDRFKADSAIPVFLLTTQVGGLGLTLTEADRVVVVDPAWNPSRDNQSVDRAYRIGQKKNVVVYRLITCGTMEEKIYRKQVFKQGLSMVSNGDEEVFRYFTKGDLRELFSANYDGFAASETQRELQRKHGGERKTDSYLDAHLGFLEGLGGFFGASDHDLLFTKKAEEATFDVPMRRVAGGAPKFSGVAQSPLAKKMQSRSQWGGAGLLSHVALGGAGPETEVADPSGAGPETEVADPSTVARLDAVDINALTAAKAGRQHERRAQELRDALLRIDSTLQNSALVSRLPDGGERLRRERESKTKELEQIEAGEGQEDSASPSKSYDLYKEAYRSSYEEAMRKQRAVDG